MYTREFLDGVKRKALRRGIWFGVLDCVERGILSLVSRVEDVVRSINLGVLIVRILKKLRDASKGGFVQYIESCGLELARKIVEQATMLGYTKAEGWTFDSGFMRYLAFLSYNKLSGWGTT